MPARHVLAAIVTAVAAITVLPGYETSRGAREETFTAFICDKPIVRWEDGLMVRVPRLELFRAWTQEPDLYIYVAPFRQEVPA